MLGRLLNVISWLSFIGIVVWTGATILFFGATYYEFASTGREMPDINEHAITLMLTGYGIWAIALVFQYIVGGDARFLPWRSRAKDPE